MGRLITVFNEVNRPAEPICDPAPTTCGPTGPRTDPGTTLGFSDDRRGDGLCSVHGGSSPVPLWTLSLAALGLAALRFRRRRGVAQ